MPSAVARPAGRRSCAIRLVNSDDQGWVAWPTGGPSSLLFRSPLFAALKGEGFVSSQVGGWVVKNARINAVASIVAVPAGAPSQVVPPGQACWPFAIR